MPTPRNRTESGGVRLEPWGEGDLPLLKRLLGDPVMMQHLGGPESDAQITERHARYLRLAASGEAGIFKVVQRATGAATGSVVYWERTYRDEPIYEIGWSVLPAFQGQGIATAATAAAIAQMRAAGKRRFLHAFPAVDNPPSNAICRKLGFTLVEESEFEYPRGSFMRCNDWRLDLSAEQPDPGRNAE